MLCGDVLGNRSVGGIWLVCAVCVIVGGMAKNTSCIPVWQYSDNYMCVTAPGKIGPGLKFICEPA